MNAYYCPICHEAIPANVYPSKSPRWRGNLDSGEMTHIPCETVVEKRDVRGIGLSRPLVIATIKGNKTETRRVEKGIDPSERVLARSLDMVTTGARPLPIWGAMDAVTGDIVETVVPKYISGDILYVKEDYRLDKRVNGMTPSGAFGISHAQDVHYCADGWSRELGWLDQLPPDYGRIRVGRFMPVWAARLWLRVESVRLERLSCITPDDVRAEGVIVHTSSQRPRLGFWRLWDRLHMEQGYGSGVDPFVWVYRFERLGVAGHKAEALEGWVK